MQTLKEFGGSILIRSLYLFSSRTIAKKTYHYFLEKLGFLPESLILGIVCHAGNSYSFEFPQITMHYQTNLYTKITKIRSRRIFVIFNQLRY